MDMVSDGSAFNSLSNSRGSLEDSLSELAPDADSLGYSLGAQFSQSLNADFLGRWADHNFPEASLKSTLFTSLPGGYTSMSTLSSLPNFSDVRGISQGSEREAREKLSLFKSAHMPPPPTPETRPPTSPQCTERERKVIAAIRQGKFGDLRPYLNLPADFGDVQSWHQDPLLLAVRQFDLAFLDVVVEPRYRGVFSPAYVNKRGKGGNTALHLACVGGRPEVVKALLRHSDLDLNIENERRETPIAVAYYWENNEIAGMIDRQMSLRGRR